LATPFKVATPLRDEPINRPKHDRGKQGASHVNGFAVNGLS
jgi:hypothetical protein